MEKKDKNDINDSLFEKIDEFHFACSSKTKIKSRLAGVGYLALSLGCVCLIKSNVYLGPITNFVIGAGALSSIIGSNRIASNLDHLKNLYQTRKNLKHLLNCVNHSELIFDDSSIKNLKFNIGYLKEITEGQNQTSSMLEIETCDYKIAYLRERKREMRTNSVYYQYDLVSLGSAVYNREAYELYNRYTQNNCPNQDKRNENDSFPSLFWDIFGNSDFEFQKHQEKIKLNTLYAYTMIAFSLSCSSFSKFAVPFPISDFLRIGGGMGLVGASFLSFLVCQEKECLNEAESQFRDLIIKLNQRMLEVDSSSLKQAEIEFDYMRRVEGDRIMTSSMLEIQTIHHKIAYLRELKIKLRNERTIQYQYDLISLDSTLYDKEEYQLYKTYKNNRSDRSMRD